jgi:hypothetical protein
MKKGAEESILALYNKIKELKDQAAYFRMEATELDKHVKVLEDQWNKIFPLITIEYEEEEVKDITTDSGISFNFDSEINKKVH